MSDTRLERKQANRRPLLPKKFSRQRLWGFGTVTLAITAVVLFLGLYPLGRVIGGLFWVDGAFSSSPIVRTLTYPKLPALLFDTTLLVVVSSFFGLIIGALLAWINERTDARMGMLTSGMPLLPFLMPPVAGAIGWVLLLSPRSGFLNTLIRGLLEPFGIVLNEGPFDIYSWPGLVFVFTLFMIPFSFLMISAGLRNMDPGLEEASRVSGARLIRTLVWVTLPALKPSVVSAVLLMFWTGFALYSVPAIIASPGGINVMSVEIVNLLGFSYPPDRELAVGLSMIVLVIVSAVWFLRNRLLKTGRHATIGGKGRRVTLLRLGRWKWVVRGLFIAYALVVIVLPIVALAIVALYGFWTPNMHLSGFSFDAIRRSIFEDPMTFRAISNSLSLGVVGAFIGVACSAVISVYVIRKSGFFARFVDATVKIPAIVPNVVLAVGFLLAFAGPPFGLSGTWFFLLIAYVIIYLPQATVASDDAASQIGKELSEASFTSGAGPAKTFGRIQLPLMVGGLAVGWVFLFVRIAGDLTASALLSGTKNTVVGYRLLEIFTNGGWAELSALALALTVVTSVVLAIVLGVVRLATRWGSK